MAAEPRPVALVTGAAHRVGRALAVGLASNGYDIALHFHASASKVDEAVKAIEHAGGSCQVFQADLRTAEAPVKLVRDAAQTMKRLDVVVNSASVMLRMPVGEISADAWDSVLDLNLRAPFLISQEAARHLPDGGSIINISDLAAFEVWPPYVPHGVSKSGLVYITQALARLLAPRIRVNAIAPGTVLLPENFDPAFASRLTETTPLKRDGTPEDVVQAMLYLLSANYVTGETIIVDGGRHIRR
jgi:NAD(P)-dependent dehydrogenase (short-subunit alcohol dehydrogenase family)